MAWKGRTTRRQQRGRWKNIIISCWRCLFGLFISHAICGVHFFCTNFLTTKQSRSLNRESGCAQFFVLLYWSRCVAWWPCSNCIHFLLANWRLSWYLWYCIIAANMPVFAIEARGKKACSENSSALVTTHNHYYYFPLSYFPGVTLRKQP